MGYVKTKVEALLYSKFKGNQATKYGRYMKPVARGGVLYLPATQWPLTTIRTGLVYLQSPWLDDQVYDPCSLPSQGFAEYKNPDAGRLMTISNSSRENSVLKSVKTMVLTHTN